MVRTIADAFRVLRSNLEITGLQEQTVASRQKAIREVLARDFIIKDTFLTGSYRRSTMIRPLKEADVDIFIVLDVKYYRDDRKRALLESIKKSLRKTYTKTPDIRPDGSAVTVTFTDFKVDVVPAFYRKGSGYLIPSLELNKWISTDPKKHVEIWTAANKAHNNDLVPLIKMIKGWNKSRNLFKSFHLETLILKALDGVTITDYPSGMRYVFDKGITLVQYKLADPAGYSDDVGAHVDTKAKIQLLVDRLIWARDRAMEADAMAADGNVANAINKWRLIVPSYFPRYG
ncbi:nucleotidyltransferase [Sinorhizobium meliloti]|uniref:CBASS oligonucleotide cyclase n=1 Tax=Rhizobium meliloti TaxID=382 RepID=UPI000FD75675|nr:CBASS oligonucleotide cyclase [Sinorhizobium meliloti]RVK48207.1 nucleotidyltransferase [Sinorhizobium meliloti]RVM66613.1 nucleotidyltransferase [Sinorhizobium meliloti]RVN69935.1 nucleotidyltransferase [Sinorhizobium meliloti]